jgi:hypothetical protein
MLNYKSRRQTTGCKKHIDNAKLPKYNKECRLHTTDHLKINYFAIAQRRGIHQ